MNLQQNFSTFSVLSLLGPPAPPRSLTYKNRVCCSCECSIKLTRLPPINNFFFFFLSSLDLVEQCSPSRKGIDPLPTPTSSTCTSSILHFLSHVPSPPSLSPFFSLPSHSDSNTSHLLLLPPIPRAVVLISNLNKVEWLLSPDSGNPPPLGSPQQGEVDPGPRGLVPVVPSEAVADVEQVRDRGGGGGVEEVVAAEYALGGLPLEAVPVDFVGEDLVGELGPLEEVAGAEVLGDPGEVLGREGAEHPPLVLAERYGSVPRWDWRIGGGDHWEEGEAEGDGEGLKDCHGNKYHMAMAEEEGYMD